MRIASPMVIVLQALTVWVAASENVSKPGVNGKSLPKFGAQQRLIHYSSHVKNSRQEHAIVYPIRSIVSGSPSPPQVPPTTYSNGNDNLAYRIAAFGKEFHIILTRNEKFLSFGLLVQHLHDTYTWLEDSDKNSLGFYDGTVQGDDRSVASFSLSHTGLSGMFQTDGDMYYIEPKKLPHPLNSSFFFSRHHPHLISRHSPLSQPLNQGSHCSNCNISQDTASSAGQQPNTPSSRPSIPGQDSGVLTHRRTSLSNTGRDIHTRTVRDTPDGKRDRSKRSISREHYVEILVVADKSMYDQHGDNVVHYVLTLLAIASSVYRDESIGNSLNLVVVNVLTSPTDTQGLNISNKSAGLSLREFCQWEHIKNEADDTSIRHHDVAVLITRENICRKPGECETLGLAELGNICEPVGSCAIIEDSGMSAAYTIAHELGHIFNLPHDDDKKCTPYLRNGENLHIMAPILDYSTSPWTWSTCSKRLLTEFLDSGKGHCLYDKPVTKKYRRIMKQIIDVSPGKLYGVDKQCQLLYGSKSKYCSYMGACKRLWCYGKYGRDSGCRTQHMPWTEGTECGKNMWCVRGECVKKGKRLLPVRGGWGKWQRFGTCSRTCDGGIKQAVRICNQPRPRHGGRYCIGRRAKYKSCNVQPCPPSDQTFRDQQCASFNGQYRINGLDPSAKWTPKYSLVPSEMCKLVCQTSAKGAFFQFKAKVMDGTKCHPDTNNVCVNGKCRISGCDNRLGSTAKIDKCGVCKGDNSSCRTIAGTFNHKPLFGYNIITKIPSGATNLDIRQYGFSVMDDNYLALKDTHGHFVINGNFTVSKFGRQIKVHGSKVAYSGSFTKVERIRSSGIIRGNLTVMVLSVGNHHSPNIHYSYDVSIKVSQIWNRHGPWTQCNKDCKGQRSRKVICQRQRDGVIVSDNLCHPKRKPRPIYERCNTECHFRWHSEYASQCSVKCGTGVAKINVTCVKDVGGKVVIRPDRDCISDGRRKPATMEKCVMRCAKWRYSTWSSCSQTCGTGGIRQRGATCVDQNGSVLADAKCASSAKQSAESCNSFDCPQWLASNWSGCSVECGEGTQLRDLTCREGSTQVASSKCQSMKKPVTKQACNHGACLWDYGVWGQCSKSCSRGIQLRAMRCRTPNWKNVHESRCMAVSQPINRRVCNVQECPKPARRLLVKQRLNVQSPQRPYSKTVSKTTRKSTTLHSTTLHEPDTEWKTYRWSGCSVSCGMGTRSRFVRCMSRNRSGPRHSSKCGHLKRPVRTEECQMGDCGYWRIGRWGACTQSCGRPGRQTRMVACMLHNNQVMRDIQCDVKRKPLTFRLCNRIECHHGNINVKNILTNQVDTRRWWRIGKWSLCSVTCGRGKQRRQVVCQLTSGTCSASRPITERSCDAGNCPYWYSSAWSQCSSGSRKRNVQCQLGHERSNIRVVPDDRCNSQSRPADRQACATSRPRWVGGRYSPVYYDNSRNRQRSVQDTRLPRSRSPLNIRRPRSGSTHSDTGGTRSRSTHDTRGTGGSRSRGTHNTRGTRSRSTLDTRGTRSRNTHRSRSRLDSGRGERVTKENDRVNRGQVSGNRRYNNHRSKGDSRPVNPRTTKSGGRGRGDGGQGRQYGSRPRPKGDSHKANGHVHRRYSIRNRYISNRYNARRRRYR